MTPVACPVTLVLALVLAAFVLHPVLHYEPSIVALLGAGLLVLVTRVDMDDALRDVEWSTLVVLRGPVHHGRRTGGDGRDRRTLAGRGQLDRRTAGVASYLLLGGSAGLSAIVDNIPTSPP